MQQIAKGIWKIVLGEPETFTPEHFRQFPVRTEAIEQIPVSRECRVSEEKIHWRKTKRGITVTLPMETQEDIYGFRSAAHGIQSGGQETYIKVNSDPVANTGKAMRRYLLHFFRRIRIICEYLPLHHLFDGNEQRTWAVCRDDGRE